MAVRHGLAPRLYRRLKKSGAQASVPADAWERLRLAYFAGASRNARLYRTLRPVLAGLRDAGIPVIVLKGAYLAEAIYGDIALRSMCDVDLMVPRTELARAEAVLLDMGGVHWQGTHAELAPGTQREDVESCCRTRHHLLPIHVRGLFVELHWTIIPPLGPFRIDAAGLWDRARPATTAGVDVLALSPEDLLLHMCLHFSRQHGLTWLRLLCDTAETIHRFRSEIDWKQVIDRAREWGVTRHVGLTFYLAGSMLGAAVPDDVLEQLVPGGLDAKVFETARETVITGIPYGKWLSPAFLGLRGREPLAHKAKLLWERVFLSRDAMLAEYPASRDSRYLYVYHARRIWDIIRKWGPALRRMPSHEWERSLSGNATLANWLESGEPVRQAEVKAKVKVKVKVKVKGKGEG